MKLSKPIRRAISTAPEHSRIGVDVEEFAAIVAAFNDAGTFMSGDDACMHHLFDSPQPAEVVRLNKKVSAYRKAHGWMTKTEAAKRVDSWRKQARDQGQRMANADKVVLSLFDKSGAWSRPWEEAGYQVHRFDIQDNPETGDVNKFNVDFFSDWFGNFDGLDIYAVLAACPCTDFAVSGARHFSAKDSDGRTVASVELVHQTLRVIEYFRPAIWAVENPVGRIEKLGGLPPWRLSFDPFHLGETYTKKTLIWGRFNAHLPIAPVEPIDGSKMHRRYGGNSLATKNARSITPEGFAYAFFMANNASDHPHMAIAGKYDRLNVKLIEDAVHFGLSHYAISSLVDDAYYFDLDDDAAEALLRAEINLRKALGRKIRARPRGLAA